MHKLPEVKDMEFSLTCLPEDLDPAADLDYDPEAVNAIREMQERSEWGWCTVKVTAHFGPISAVAYLGACSCDSEEDFRSNSDYLEDMKEEAAEDVRKQISSLLAQLAAL